MVLTRAASGRDRRGRPIRRASSVETASPRHGVAKAMRPSNRLGSKGRGRSAAPSTPRERRDPFRTAPPGRARGPGPTSATDRLYRHPCAAHRHRTRARHGAERVAGPVPKPPSAPLEGRPSSATDQPGPRPPPRRRRRLGRIAPSDAQAQHEVEVLHVGGDRLVEPPDLCPRRAPIGRHRPCGPDGRRAQSVAGVGKTAGPAAAESQASVRIGGQAHALDPLAAWLEPWRERPTQDAGVRERREQPRERLRARSTSS